MKVALLGLLLTFAAPAPYAESAAGIEEDLVVESARASRSSSARVPSLKLVRRPDPSRPRTRFLDTSLPQRAIAVWTPRLFSRPPPRG